VGPTVLLVGFGMQARAALHDLVADGRVARILVADNRPDLAADLAPYPGDRVVGHVLDATDRPALTALMRDADVVIDALPGPMALGVGRLAADVGVHVVSSMYYRDPAEADPDGSRQTAREIADLHRRAAGRGVVLLTEFGLDPGLDLVLAVDALRQMDEVHELRTYGAGLPAAGARDNPLGYKFSWSPSGVLRSYRRPARLITGGAVVEIPAERVFEPGSWHALDVARVADGLECFPNGDAVHYAELLGIRETVKHMGRYTCRLPGHCAFWDRMVKTGLLDDTPIRVGDAVVSPLELVAAQLAARPEFRYADHEADLAFIRVDVRGVRGAQRARVVCDLVDTRDFTTGLTAMQRTVGFTMSLGARLILDGRLTRPGLLTALDVPYDLVFPVLERHGIRVTREESAWE
jgi:lysine 6-dehydrogenase